MLSSRTKTLAFLMAQWGSVIANANQELVSFDGDWRGKWADSVGESGDGTLTIKESKDQTMAGLWVGDIRVQGERLGVNVFSFEGGTGNKLYRGTGSLNEDKLTINYSVTRNDEGGKHYGWGTLTRDQTDPLEAKVAPQDAASQFDGEWRGKWENSIGESGEDTFDVKEKGDSTLSGLWGSTIPIRGERVGGGAFLFEGRTDRRQYNGVGVLADQKLVIKYVAKRLDAGGKYFGWELLTRSPAPNERSKQSPQVAAEQVEPRSLITDEEASGTGRTSRNYMNHSIAFVSGAGTVDYLARYKSLAVKMSPGNDADRQFVIQVPNTIIGRAVDVDQQPVSGAGLLLFRVNRFDATRDRIAQTKTDANGRFRFDKVIDITREFPDEKIPAAEEEGEVLYQLIIRAPSKASEFRLISPQNLVRRDNVELFELWPAATLSGHITGPDGKSVVGALVSAVSTAFSRWEDALSARTDADGNYAIKDVGPFDMKEFLEYQEAMRRLVVKAKGTPESNLQLFLAPPLLTIEHPNFAVKKTDFENIPGTKDIQLAPPAIVEGRVLYADSGQAAAGAIVAAATSPNSIQSLSNKDQLLAVHRAATRTDADGHYRVGNLPAGTYDIWAERTGWINNGICELAVAGQTTTMVPDLLLTKGGILRVSIVNPKTHEPLDFQGDARLVVVTRPFGKQTNRPFLPQGSSLDADGKFEFRVVPGNNSIQFISLETPYFIAPSDEVLRALNTQKTIDEGKTTEVELSIKSPEIDALLPPNKETTARLNRVGQMFGEFQIQAAIDQLDPIIAEYPALLQPQMMRAEAYQRLGQLPRAIEQYERILKSDPPIPFSYIVRNNLAFLLATAADKSLRDAPRAVRLAEDALKIPGGTHPDTYDTLAAAYAETGDFERASATQQKAIDLAPDNEAFQEHLELYQSNRTLGESGPEGEHQ